MRPGDKITQIVPAAGYYAAYRESDDLLRLGLHRLPAGEFPRLRALGGELTTYDGERELDEGLDIILAGLRPRTTSRVENA